MSAKVLPIIEVLKYDLTLFIITILFPAQSHVFCK